MLVVPPARNEAAALGLALLYGLWAGGVALVARARRIAFVRWIAATLVVDVVAISVLCLRANTSRLLTISPQRLLSRWMIWTHSSAGFGGASFFSSRRA